VSSLCGTIRRSSARKMEILFVTAEEDRVAVAAEGEFLFEEGAYRNTYHYLFTIGCGRITAGREYLDTSVAARFFAPPSP
jgi:ketosteroid isomerase-like protein